MMILQYYPTSPRSYSPQRASTVFSELALIAAFKVQTVLFSNIKAQPKVIQI